MEPVQNKIIHCDTHSQTLIDGLGKLWKENQFCDITLKVEGEEFICHKNVLAANSEYFTSVFARGFKGQNDKKVIILPPAFQCLPFETLLEYFYSGNLVLSSKNAEGVFKLADYLKLTTVVEFTTKYLEETLDGSNCISRFIVADSIKYKTTSEEHLEETAARLIVKEITKASATVEFIELSGELLSKILILGSQPESAEALFLSVLKWVGHSEINRQPFLGDLLKLVPVAGLSFEFYKTHIKTEELLRRNPEGLQWVVDSVMPHFMELLRIAPVVSHEANAVCVVQNPQESLFVACLIGSGKCYQLQISNPTTLPVSEQPEIYNFSAISHKKRIYLMCGTNTKKTFMLEEGRSWVESEVDLYFDRFAPGSIAMEDDLFVIGGCNIDTTDEFFGVGCCIGVVTNSCAKFNFATQKRLSMPNMNKSRTRPGVGVFENSIYAVSGGSIERFDPREAQWSVVGSLNPRMRECSSATNGNFLFNCDIFNGRVVRFDFRSNRSEEISSLWADDGRGYWITSLNDQMYAARGNETVLKYNKEGDSWSEFRRGLDLICPIIMPWV